MTRQFDGADSKETGVAGGWWLGKVEESVAGIGMRENRESTGRSGRTQPFTGHDRGTTGGIRTGNVPGFIEGHSDPRPLIGIFRWIMPMPRGDYEIGRAHV